MAGWRLRRLAFASLLSVFSFSQSPSGDLPLVELVRKVADVQRDQPWFWSPPLQGMGEIPYTFHTLHRRRRLDPRNREVKLKQGEGGYYREWRNLHLERIADNGYTHTRCLSQDGISPCAGWLVQALSRDSRKWSNFTAVESAKVLEARQPRRQRRSERLPKGSRFSIEMIKSEDGRLLPGRVVSGIPKANQTEEDIAEYTNYRRFRVESEIIF